MIGGALVSDPRLDGWNLSADAWRLSGKLNNRYVDLFLKAAGGHRIPTELMDRIYSLGIPPEIVYGTLKSIRKIEDWSGEWVETAQHYLGHSRRETSAGNFIEAEKSRYLAGSCYHVAQIMELRDFRTRDSCRAWAASLAKRALSVVSPNARHFVIPWKDQKLPVLFEVPEFGDGPFGLVVLLNGLSQSKEETFQWAPRFLAAGYAVLAVDSPGTGEATGLGPIDPNATDILDGVVAMLGGEAAIDLNRMVLVGAGLGGNEAIRIARRNPRVMAVVAVTPVVQPSRWISHSPAILHTELRDAMDQAKPELFVEMYDVLSVAESLQLPMLIFGAGRDVIVPPNESQELAEQMGDRATFAWYPDLGHCLYAAADQWSWDAATWIAAVGEARVNGAADTAELAEIGRMAIEQGTYVSPEAAAFEEEEDFTEYARLVTNDED